MLQQPIGIVEQDGDLYTLLLERDYPVPITSVWRSLIEPERLEKWLGKATVDPRQGGSLRIDFDDKIWAGGEILGYDPPNLLEFEWGEMGESSVVRFDLRETDTGTHLTLTHSKQSKKMAAGTAPGWHAHLDVFEAAILGRDIDWDVDWQAAWGAAKPRYDGVSPSR